MSEGEYIIIEEDHINFQKALNQWRHNFIFYVIWMEYDPEYRIFRALIKRWKKS